jgi:hypothetical protein
VSEAEKKEESGGLRWTPSCAASSDVEHGRARIGRVGDQMPQTEPTSGRAERADEQSERQPCAASEQTFSLCIRVSERKTQRNKDRQHLHLKNEQMNGGYLLPV